MLKRIAILLFVLAASVAAQPKDWRAEDDIRKRAELGLKVAEDQLESARAVYRKGDPYEAQAQLEESLATMLEVYQMILEEGEDLRKNARRYKKVEITLRGIARRLEDFERQAEVVDRGPIARARQTVSLMRDNLLHAMLQGGKLSPVEKVQP